MQIIYKSQKNCQFLLCGDFNSRTSSKSDYVEADEVNHMSVLPDDYISDTQMPRFSEDGGHINSNGLLLLDFCKQTGLRIMNGRVGNDKGLGKFTFVGSRGSSVVDYVLGSQKLFNFIKEFEVQDPNILSDHCLIKFSFEFLKQSSSDIEHENYERVSSKYVWCNEKRDEFVHLLSQASVSEKLSTLNSNIYFCETKENIESHV